MKNQKTIKLYRYDAGCHCNGTLFPPYDNRQTDWSSNKQEQVDLYNSASKEHFDLYELEEMAYYNKSRSVLSGDNMGRYMFIWCMLYEIEVPLVEWKKCVREDNYESLGYLVDFDYTSLAERGMYPNGRPMSEKKFNSIVYDPYLETNKGNHTGVFKPKGCVYGKYNVVGELTSN